jgi:predicted DNA-binding transcriptional regulator YafY
VRTFAIDRVQGIAQLEERFSPSGDVLDEAFPHSLGVHSGTPEPVEIVFDPEVAAYIRSREWHASQTLLELGDGRVQLTLKVCVDHALRSWILGFGASARVVAPERLALDLAREHDRARAHYTGAHAD